MEELEMMLREPCPWRIVEDIGMGLSIGAIGGGTISFYKGFRMSPPGLSTRLYSGLMAMKARGPVFGGNFAIWSGMFSSLDCCLIGLRGKEDPWNSIVAGGAASGILTARNGPVSMMWATLSGALILGLIEGVQIAWGRHQAQASRSIELSQAPDDARLSSVHKSRWDAS